MVPMGLRTDANDYSSEMSNPLDQLSPRVSASYALSPRVSLSFNTGRYYQLPPYTVLSFRSNQGDLVNQTTGIKYISADHFVLGIESRPTPFSKLTLEGFYKSYQDYPFILSDSISLANLGGDFGVIGNEPASPYSDGRSYGIEVRHFQHSLARPVVRLALTFGLRG